MATTTPNFGWSVPTSSDLVKNGAVAIETLGDSIDASMVDLKGGTTGQVLAKASNSDMDFNWVANTAGFIGVRVFKSAAQVIATATSTYLSFDSETFDTNGFHSNVTNNTRLTVPAGLGGYYLITANVRYSDSVATGRKVGGIPLNRTTNLATYEFQPFTAPVEANAIVSTIALLAVGDYVEIDAFQTSGVNQSLSFATNSTFFQMQYLGA